MNTTESFVPATKRQLWALYCITKKDYRNDNLSKDDAAELIKKLGNPEHKKISKTKDLKSELLEFLTEKFDAMKKAADESLQHQSVIETDPNFTSEKNMKQYAFIGVGCGITYLVYRKNNKKAEEINELARKIRWDEAEKMYLNTFTKEQRKYYENIGCPLEAIWSQDQGMQQSYWGMILEFMTKKGIKNVRMHSVLD